MTSSRNKKDARITQAHEAYDEYVMLVHIEIANPELRSGPFWLLLQSNVFARFDGELAGR